MSKHYALVCRSHLRCQPGVPATRPRAADPNSKSQKMIYSIARNDLSVHLSDVGIDVKMR